MDLGQVVEVRPFGNKYTDLDECLLNYLDWYGYNHTRVTDFVSAVRFLKLACDGTVYLFHLMRDSVMALKSQYTNVTDLDKALDQYTSDYVNQVDTISDPVQLVSFLKVALDNNLRLFHMLRAELTDAQNKQVRSTLLHLPIQYR